MSDLLSIIIVILIIAIVLDGLRRARNARRGELKLSDNVRKTDDLNESGKQTLRSEFPSGGARPKASIQNESLVDSQNNADLSDELGIESHHEHGSAEYVPPSSNASTIQDMQSGFDRDPPRQASLELEEPVPMLMETVKDANIDSEIDLIEETEGGSRVRGQADDIDSQTLELNVDEYSPDDDSIAHTASDHIEPKLGAFDELDTLELSEATHPRATDGPAESIASSFSKSANSLFSMARHAGETGKDAAIPEETVAKDGEMTPVSESPEEILIINVMGASGAFFSGEDLLAAFTDEGLKYGQMGIFHRHLDKDGDAAIIYSVANMIEPGNFDFANMASTTTPGVCMFLTLPTVCEAPKAYDDLVKTARSISRRLQGELKDENRSTLTNQSIEHGRQRVMEFERKYRLKQKQSKKR